MKNSPLVSIVITTLNEEKNIENCIRSILSQTYKNTEIIVVDNDSSDRTKEIAKRYTDKVFNFGPERSAQRNHGIEKAKGEYVIYLDADMILDSKVIEKCVEKAQNNADIVALYVSEIVMGKSFWSRVRRFERSFYDATVIDCVRFIKKSAFVEVGGFDESMTGPEDWDLDKKLRNIGKVALIKTPIHHNEAEFNLKKYLAKKGYYAQSFDKYITKWGKDDPDVKKQFGMKYRFFGVFVEKGKWVKLVCHPFLTSGMYFLRFLVGISFLASKRMT